MSKENSLLVGRSPGELYDIVKERLDDTNTELTSFLFHHGANIYVFSYQKQGRRKHIFIDAGDWQYRSQILPILIGNDINPTDIERIIITHCHHDHYGLAGLLAKESKAKILVHSSFRSFVESDIRQQEAGWLGNFAPSQLKEWDFEYLLQPDKSAVRSFGGVDFPILVEPIEIGKAGELMILACPESVLTHTSDQIIVLYSPEMYPNTDGEMRENLQPTGGILFSGDLWLMRGPVRDQSVSPISPRRDYREQDSKTKEALKSAFPLIRVKPGHGEEFIGSRIIPRSLLADRDLLLLLGYSLNANKSILRQKDLAPKIAALREQAYTSFIKELLFWKGLGYTLSEISALLVRIYKEQSGGDTLAAEDRKQRRQRLKATLTRLRDDKVESEELHRLAQSTLSELKRVL